MQVITDNCLGRSGLVFALAEFGYVNKTWSGFLGEECLGTRHALTAVLVYLFAMVRVSS